MHLTAKEKKDVVIRKSRNGRGVFARREFLPGETVFRVMGKRITCNEDDEMDDRTRANTYRYDADTYISPAGRVGDLLNHSCAPNAKVVRDGAKLLIVAALRIPAGEEVAIDYSTILGADDVWEMRCNCGAKNCRGIIRSFNTLPPTLRKKYRALGMVPAYILAA